MRAGTPAQLPLREVAATPAPVLQYSFRYFQDFEGDLMLPTGFTPGRVEIELQPRGGGGPVKRSFDWASVTG